MAGKQIELRIATVLDDKGVQAALKGLQQIQKASKDQVQAAQGAAKLAQAQSQVAQATAKAAQATDRAAISAQKLTQATAQAEAAQSRAASAALRLQQATAKAAQPPSKGLHAYFEDLGGQIKSAALGVVAFDAALSAARATAQSFADAFKFKTELDATNQSIAIQLKGLRDSGQVFAEAESYAQRYKLTQQETTASLQASVGILRTSNASIEETFGVLQRLTVLAPGKTIEDAAFSVRELASGDITSLADQFNISRGKAYEMRDAIQSGADVVTVLSDYLDNAGVSMDTLKIRTEGAAGKFKELSQAQEEFQLAQADFAAGPGMVVLEGQIANLRAQSQLFAGDFESAGATVRAQSDANQAATIAWVKSLFGLKEETAAVTEATKTQASATQSNTTATAAATTATTTITKAQLDDLAAKQQSAQATQELALLQADLATLAPQVAGGLVSDANAASALAARYNIAYQEALKLIQAQAALARATGEARLAGQAAHTTTYARPGANAPGRGGAGDDAIANVAAQQQARRRAEEATRRASPGAQGASDADIASVVKLQEAQKDAAEAARDLAYENANVAGKRAILTEEYNKAVAAEGAESASALRAKLALDQYNNSQVKAAGGAKARKTEAQKAAEAEATTAAKIVDIQEQAAEKLIAIDQRVAEERAKAYRDLAQTISETTADMVASQEANDLDLVGASEDQAKDLAAREQAEAKARIAAAEAVSEAQQRSAEGDAETARKVYDERQKQIGEQQDLDEKYYKKQAELAGNDEAQAALKQQYDEATQEIANATQTRIQLAEDEARQKQDAVQAEKQAVLDGAAAQVQALGGTKNAADVALKSVQDLGTGLTSLPKEVQTRVVVTYETKGTPPKGAGEAPATTSAGGSGAKMAGGGTLTGVTSGPMTVTLGDNPGGVEAYSISAVPISGTGRSTAGAGHLHLAGGTQGDVDAAAAAARARLGSGTVPQIAVGGGASSGGSGGGGGSAAANADDQLKAIEQALSVLDAIADLETKLNSMDSRPLDVRKVQQLADDAMLAAQALGRLFVALSEDQNDAFGRFTDTISNAIGVLSDAADLRETLLAVGPPIDQATVEAIAKEAFDAARALGAYFVQFSQTQTDQFERFADTISNAIGVLSDAAGLRDDLVDIGPPLDEATLSRLGYDAQQARRFVAQYLVPVGEETADAIGRYTDTAEQAVGLLRDTIGLRADAAEAGAPIDETTIDRLAEDTARVVRAVQGRLMPATEEETEALQRYADAAGSATSALSSVFDLTAKRFLDYQSPTDAQIGRLVEDTDRVVQAVNAAATIYDTEGLAAAQAWAEAAGATFDTIEQGLVVFDKLRFSDIGVDLAKLSAFQAATGQIVDAVGALASQAQGVDQAGLARLTNVFDTYTAINESLITAAAVPYGNLPSFAGALGGGDGTGGVTVNVINPPAALDVPGLIRQVEQAVSRQMGARR